MKSNSGVSLIALIVTIIVMIIMAAATIRIATDGIDSTIDARTVNEKKEIETAIIRRFSNYSLNEEVYPLIGSLVIVADLSEIDNINLSDIDYIRKLSPSDLRTFGISNTTGNSYIVDYVTGDVYGPVE